MVTRAWGEGKEEDRRGVRSGTARRDFSRGVTKVLWGQVIVLVVPACHREHRRTLYFN